MIILASKSASRCAMLEAAGLEFAAKPADIDERSIEAKMAGAGPSQIAVTLAVEKAMNVSRETPDHLVLGSDSLVVCDGRRFDKPCSRDQAHEHLCFFSSKVIELHSAAALVQDGQVLWSDSDVAHLSVTSLSDGFIENYLDAEWPDVAGCVGVFRIEGRGVQLFDRIDGDYFTILGMPLLKVQSALRNMG